MNKYLLGVVANILDRRSAERSIQDLRLLIERFTMNRYSKREEYEYSILFSDPSLLDVKLTLEDIEEIKIEIFYLLLRYGDYSVLFAKCIKVLFDVNLWAAIRRCVYAYMNEDDTVCELIFAITDTHASWKLDADNYTLFVDVAKNGGEQSRSIASERLAYFQKDS